MQMANAQALRLAPKAAPTNASFSVADLNFPQTRWSLVGRAAHGGAAQLIERYADCLAAYLRLKFPAVPAIDFDDLIQEVLLHLLAQPEAMTKAYAQDGGKFRYYLATLAFNEARNVLRRQRRAVAYEQPLDHEPVALPSEVDHAWELAAVYAAWADLRGWVASGELDADAVMLLERHVREGIPLRQLASESGQSLATCHRRVAKARTWLQSALSAHLKPE